MLTILDRRIINLHPVSEWGMTNADNKEAMAYGDALNQDTRNRLDNALIMLDETDATADRANEKLAAQTAEMKDWGGDLWDMQENMKKIKK